MKVYLVQHGEAKAEVEDTLRPLTDRGRAEVERVAALARKLEIRPSQILHSGKLRAKQTDKLASLLLCGNEAAGIVQFRYGAIVSLDRQPDRVWRLQWILAPDLV